ncbi:ATP-binding cassette domain-containing protein [Octadecabacter sp. R77987]|uniref:ATP-binding cassette domain-containing protein n=1 Tax=Octadecabacter sp. R77987 TaxID=3093874 RepID=UPI00366F26AE
MGDDVLQIAGLNHWFGTGEARKQAIYDFDLNIARGGLTILMGPSGSGKTTILTLAGCLRDVQDGSVRLLGHELNGAPKATNEMLRKRLGFIFQAHNLHESLTAEQNVLMGLQVHGLRGPTYTQAARKALELVGLGDRMTYLPQNLSGGQKQRVAVARALVGNPDIIFADEPTAALDKDSGVNVVRMLKALGRARGTTTVMVTHDNRILDMADRILGMEDGRLIKDSLASV